MERDLPFRELEHTADRAFLVRGRDLPELFVHAAHALFRLEAANHDAAESISRRVEISAGDIETLLVNWLNELLYLHEAHHETYSRFQIQIVSDAQLQATLYGGPDRGTRRFIKAVTFHGLRVKRLPEGWEATIVVDV